MSTGSLFVNFEARCWAEQARDLLYLAVAVRAGLGVASGRCEEAPDEREKKEAKQKKKKRNDDVNHRSSLPSFGQRARSLFSPSCTHPSPCMAAEKRKGARSPSRKGGSRSLSLRACKEKTEAFDRKKESESESERRRKKKKTSEFFLLLSLPFFAPHNDSRTERESRFVERERQLRPFAVPQHPRARALALASCLPCSSRALPRQSVASWRPCDGLRYSARVAKASTGNCISLICCYFLGRWGGAGKKKARRVFLLRSVLLWLDLLPPPLAARRLAWPCSCTLQQWKGESLSPFVRL